jgi:hypothetical protein
MGLNWPKNGPNHVPSFEISGLPYVTRSNGGGEVTNTVVHHPFPFVTRYFAIGNPSANNLRVGFTENGVKSAVTANYFLVAPFTSASVGPRHELRCKELFFVRDGSGNTDFEIVAGLTTIPHGQMAILTGSQDATRAEGIIWTGVG